MEKDTFKFKTNKLQINKSKRMLYCIHNVINYAEDVNSYHVFRNENKKIFDVLYKQILKKLYSNYNSLFETGFFLDKKYNQSINKKYLKKFYKI